MNASTSTAAAPLTAATAPASATASAMPAAPTGPVSALPRPAGSAASGRRRSGFGALLVAEAIKLRRSSVWVVAVLLPLLAVITGTANFMMNRESFDGWISLSSQVTLFYSMMFCSLGIALLASTVWRTEHRGTSWNAMRTTPHSPVTVVAAKTLVIFLPVLAMQVVLLALTWLAGSTVAGLGPAMPATFIISGLLAVVSAAPLVAVQSLLSMLLRSFAAPVALAFIGCVVSFGLLLKQSPMSYAVPQGILSRTLMLGSSAMDYAGDLTVSSFLSIMAAIITTSIVFWGLLALVARRTGGVR
ncbi:ABC transporter permease [Actinomyces viscosus]|uniref:ABC transporter permease n=1 Tax=Actinomyces viscosus TaxID=1656 RepID=UPI0028E438BA|nr:ABC transporter permease [Actinomyces viscosus]